MPSKSQKQHDMMQAAAHDPDFASTIGVPQKVAREFITADKKKGKFRLGRKKGSKNKEK
jgi:hypothetical protein